MVFALYKCGMFVKNNSDEINRTNQILSKSYGNKDLPQSGCLRVEAFDESVKNCEKNEKENLEGYVTRQELSEAKLQIKADVMKEVAQLFGNAAMNTQQVVTPALMQQMMSMIPENAEKKKDSDKPEEEAEPTDAALEEMSVLFAQGNFGEE